MCLGEHHEQHNEESPPKFHQPFRGDQFIPSPCAIISSPPSINDTRQSSGSAPCSLHVFKLLILFVCPSQVFTNQSKHQLSNLHTLKIQFNKQFILMRLHSNLLNHQLLLVLDYRHCIHLGYIHLDPLLQDPMKLDLSHPINPRTHSHLYLGLTSLTS